MLIDIRRNKKIVPATIAVSWVETDARVVNHGLKTVYIALSLVWLNAGYYRDISRAIGYVEKYIKPDPGKLSCVVVVMDCDEPDPIGKAKLTAIARAKASGVIPAC